MNDDGMKRVGEIIDFPHQAQGWTSREPEASVMFHSKDGITYHLTTTEAAKYGYREVTNPEGVRIVQFGLCLDERDEWIYPPFKRSEETLEEMLDRNDQTRRRLGMCRKSPRGEERRYRD